MAVGSRVEKIQDILRSLRSVSPDIVGSAIVSTDGFIVASLLPTTSVTLGTGFPWPRRPLTLPSDR